MICVPGFIRPLLERNDPEIDRAFVIAADDLLKRPDGNTPDVHPDGSAGY